MSLHPCSKSNFPFRAASVDTFILLNLHAAVTPEGRAVKTEPPEPCAHKLEVFNVLRALLGNELQDAGEKLIG
jgi:hypothetical protein